WLVANFGLSDRQAQKYMKYAKTAFKADLREAEEVWRQVSGNPAKKGKADKTTDLNKDDKQLFALLEKSAEKPAEGEDIAVVIAKLRERYGLETAVGVVHRSLASDYRSTMTLAKLTEKRERGVARG